MAEKRKYVVSMLRRLFSGVMAAAIVYAVTLLILTICGIRPYIVMSGSMEPAIRTGSLCFVNTNTSFSAIKPGDVIAFETVWGMVTHRAVRIGEEEIVTKGDANEVSDSFAVREENFRGETLVSIPYLGFLHYGVGNGLGRLACLGIILLIAIVEIPEKTEE